MVLSTHIDTVPPFFASSEDDLFLYGRGSCDAKGIVAAQIAAAERLRGKGVLVGLLFVVGEERDSAGAAVANLHPKGSRYSDQWGADGESAGACLKRSAAGRVASKGQDGSLGLS